jgi:hypothetical protein
MRLCNARQQFDVAEEISRKSMSPLARSLSVSASQLQELGVSQLGGVSD